MAKPKRERLRGALSRHFLIDPSYNIRVEAACPHLSELLTLAQYLEPIDEVVK